MYLVWGPMSFAYLALSLFFSIGLHPLGARWIQRHYLAGEGEQETFSYYGSLNLLTFNVGYHNEHHDFPSVAWNRLPRINAVAPEFYDELAAHMSWTRLLFRFLFDPEITLYSRMTRETLPAIRERRWQGAAAPRSFRRSRLGRSPVVTGSLA